MSRQDSLKAWSPIRSDNNLQTSERVKSWRGIRIFLRALAIPNTEDSPGDEIAVAFTALADLFPILAPLAQENCFRQYLDVLNEVIDSWPLIWEWIHYFADRLLADLDLPSSSLDIRGTTIPRILWVIVSTAIKVGRTIELQGIQIAVPIMKLWMKSIDEWNTQQVELVYSVDMASRQPDGVRLVSDILFHRSDAIGARICVKALDMILRCIRSVNVLALTDLTKLHSYLRFLESLFSSQLPNEQFRQLQRAGLGARIISVVRLLVRVQQDPELDQPVEASQSSLATCALVFVKIIDDTISNPPALQIPQIADAVDSKLIVYIYMMQYTSQLPRKTADPRTTARLWRNFLAIMTIIVRTLLYGSSPLFRAITRSHRAIDCLHAEHKKEAELMEEGRFSDAWKRFDSLTRSLVDVRRRYLSQMHPPVCWNLDCDYDGRSPGSSHTIKWCFGCKTAQYCSAECQAKHWSNHRTHCGPAHNTDLTVIYNYVPAPVHVLSRRETGFKQWWKMEDPQMFEQFERDHRAFRRMWKDDGSQ